MTIYQDLLKQIEAQLAQNESIRYSGFGTFEIKPRTQGFIMNMFRGMVRNGIFAATNTQLVLCVRKRGKAQLFRFPYAGVDTVNIGRSMLSAYLDFTTTEHKVRLRPLNQGDAPSIETLMKKRDNSEVAAKRKTKTKNDKKHAKK